VYLGFAEPEALEFFCFSFGFFFPQRINCEMNPRAGKILAFPPVAGAAQTAPIPAPPS
jgi:hypothetical protein